MKKTEFEDDMTFREKTYFLLPIWAIFHSSGSQPFPSEWHGGAVCTRAPQSEWRGQRWDCSSTVRSISRWTQADCRGGGGGRLGGGWLVKPLVEPRLDGARHRRGNQHSRPTSSEGEFPQHNAKYISQISPIYLKYIQGPSTGRPSFCILLPAFPGSTSPSCDSCPLCATSRGEKFLIFAEDQLNLINNTRNNFKDILFIPFSNSSIFNIHQHYIIHNTTINQIDWSRVYVAFGPWLCPLQCLGAFWCLDWPIKVYIYTCAIQKAWLNVYPIIKCFTLKDDDDEDNGDVNDGGEDPTGRERVQNALGEDTSSAAVTRSDKSPTWF